MAALALALKRGDLSEAQAIEGFVALVVTKGKARVRVAGVIAKEARTSARFAALFERLAFTSQPGS